jgi:PKD repeat protein
MNIKKPLIFLAIVSIFFSCTKDSTPPAPPAPPPPAAPVANFTYTGAGVAPSTVTFTNTSTNATSYLWDFGNNATSVEASPTYKYTAGGVYTVKLTATGAGGSNSTTKTVNITTPTTFKIVSIKITALPLTKANGASWDVFPSSSGPDVYFKITDDASTTFYTHPFYVEDVVASKLPLDFLLQNSSRVASPHIITSANFSKKIALEVYDYDPSGDERMGGMAFAPSSLTTGADAYPTTFTATISGLTAVFTVKWE